MKWEERALGEVIRHRSKFFLINDPDTYRRVTVKTGANGIVLRDQVTGFEIKTKKQQAIKADEFLVAEIDAKVGGYGIVPEQYEGAVVSSHYFRFALDRRQLEPRWLHWGCKRPHFQEQIRARGSTNYASTRPDKILNVRLPLPPLNEQRRIVAKLDAAAERIARIEAAQSANAEDLDSLLGSLLFDNPSATLTPMRQLVTLRPPDTKVESDQTYDFAGVYSFGRGVFRSVTKSGLDFAYASLTQVRAGEFTYPKLMAWEGALGVVPPECNGCFVSPEFPVFTVQQDRIFPELLDAYFRSSRVWPEIAAISSGTNARRRRLQPSSFLNFSFPLPNRADQDRIRVTLRARNRLRAAQAARAVDLALLMPSLLDRAFQGEL